MNGIVPTMNGLAIVPSGALVPSTILFVSIGGPAGTATDRRGPASAPASAARKGMRCRIMVGLE